MLMEDRDVTAQLRVKMAQNNSNFWPNKCLKPTSPSFPYEPHNSLLVIRYSIFDKE